MRAEERTKCDFWEGKSPFWKKKKKKGKKEKSLDVRMSGLLRKKIYFFSSK